MLERVGAGKQLCYCCDKKNPSVELMICLQQGHHSGPSCGGAVFMYLSFCNRDSMLEAAASVSLGEDQTIGDIIVP